VADLAARRLSIDLAARRLSIDLAARRLAIDLAARRLAIDLAARRLAILHFLVTIAGRADFAVKLHYRPDRIDTITKPR
jgi:hypothetical protein